MIAPAPWRSQETGTATFWNVVDKDGVMVATAVSKELADAIALGRNAFGVTTRRCWGVAFHVGFGWKVPDSYIGVPHPAKYWPDPFTALVEADKAMKPDE